MSRGERILQWARMRGLGLLCLFLAGVSYGGDQQFATIGDFPLASGQTIRDCRLGYRTDGTLSDDRSNVVVVLTWFGGKSASLASSIGPGKMFDTDRWYVVTIDALGNGVSSSPSNSSIQPGVSFPRFTIGDMVRSQHQLLTRVLKLERVHAGASRVKAAVCTRTPSCTTATYSTCPGTMFATARSVAAASAAWATLAALAKQ